MQIQLNIVVTDSNPFYPYCVSDCFCPYPYRDRLQPRLRYASITAILTAICFDHRYPFQQTIVAIYCNSIYRKLHYGLRICITKLALFRSKFYLYCIVCFFVEFDVSVIHFHPVLYYTGPVCSHSNSHETLFV